MKALDLDFHRVAPASPWAGWLLLAIALFLAADVALRYRELHASIAGHEAALARLEEPARAALRASSRRDAVPPEEIAFARETIARLSVPWQDLFSALESVRPENVSLLALEPDRDAGTVVIRAEANDYAAALAYVSALRRAPGLGSAYLVRHETREGGGPRPLSFTVSARWKAGGPAREGAR